jgi:hypothetical protein
MHYRALVVEGQPPEAARPALDVLERAGRVLFYVPLAESEAWIEALDRLAPPDVRVSPAVPGLRVRHVVKAGVHVYLFFNERREDLSTMVELGAQGAWRGLDPVSGEEHAWEEPGVLRLAGHAVQVLCVRPPHVEGA